MPQLPSEKLNTDPPSGSPPPQPGLVRIAQYSIAFEADLHAAALNAEGIKAQIFGDNINMVNLYWQGFNLVDLCVPAQDAQRAAKILAEIPTDALEPAPMPQDAAPPVDQRGQPLVPVAVFSTVHELRDAQTVLASGDIPAFAPRLVPRGNHPAGAGNRFILQVAQDDLDRALSLLAQERQDDLDQPRCPKCGSWRVRQSQSLIADLAHLVGVGQPPQDECLVCHYRANPAEFAADSHPK